MNKELIRFIGKRWNLEILEFMEFDKYYRFSDFISKFDINHTLLSNNLKKFIKLGLMFKVGKEYTLTVESRGIKRLLEWGY